MLPLYAPGMAQVDRALSTKIFVYTQSRVFAVLEDVLFLSV